MHNQAFEFFPSSSASAPALASPLVMEPHSVQGPSHLDLMRGDDPQTAYVQQKDRLIEAIDDTKEILQDLRAFNKESWVVRYPTFKDAPSPPRPSPTHNIAPRRPGTRRSITFADDPTYETEVVMATSSSSSRLKRSMTLASIHDDPHRLPGTPETDESGTSSADTSCTSMEEQEGSLIPSDFAIIRLDLKIGPNGSSTSPTALVSQLEKASIANLIDQRIGSSLSHIDKLRTRIEDTSSKVLVTGDLNAGKSTFVNAMLGRDIMPVDQQPCTTLFCEVHDFSENEHVEEVHVVNEGSTYSREDEKTFTRAAITELEGIVTESDAERRCILYVKDTREPNKSLLHNGIVDISLIDAPGLNRDSLKTTAVFARQEEIDVVVFVISAENHFTLSAKDFLWNASNEKAYLFVVVNKFDQIKDKARCKRAVLDQLKSISPRTWDDSEDLVHFVDSEDALAKAAFPEGNSTRKSSVPADSFENLETSLRSFVLSKRAKSKLMPATTYLSNLLSDINLLAGANAIVAQAEQEQAQHDLDRSKPVLEKMKQGQQGLEDSLVDAEDNASSQAGDVTAAMLEVALDRVGRGEIAVDKSMVKAGNRAIPIMPAYPGIFGVWDYAAQVRYALLESLDMVVALAEDEARQISDAGIKGVFELQERYMPEGASKSKLVFMPEAMFNSRRRDGRPRSAIVAGGTQGLGLGLLQRQDLMEVSILDIFDVHHRLILHFGGQTGKTREDDDHTSLGLLSLGLGAMTVVGGKTMGLRSVLEGIVRVSEVFGNPKSRRWAGPMLGALTLGLSIYFITELPRTIPRTVGRHIKASLVQADEQLSSALVTPRPNFQAHHTQRVQKETRKVMRLAAWELRQKFRDALVESEREVKDADERLRKAGKAFEWFGKVEERTEGVREKADMVMC